MGTLFEHYDVPKYLGSEICIAAHYPAIYVSEHDEVFCYTGICLKEEKRYTISLHSQPYYLKGKHSIDQRITKIVSGFFRLKNGCIYLDNFVDNQYRDEYYKQIDCHIRYPVAAEIYYGIMVHGEEDDDLTRAVFGLTCSELDEVLEGYSKILGIHSPYIQYPRLTRSVKTSNYCDLTELWIPEQFPYIAFHESGYDFSHISLWGGYRYIQLLIRQRTSLSIEKALLEVGVNKSVIENLLSIDDYSFSHATKVTKTIINENAY